MLVRVKDLSKRYNNKAAVNHIDFEIERGEAFALLGSNGAGKTTTLKMLLGLAQPDSGAIYKDGPVTVGYSPETPYFPPHLTGAEVLAYYGRLQGLSREDVNAAIPAYLAAAGLKNGRTRVKHYSKGMLQRLALAQALLGEPQLLILDEPCAGLDALGRLEMLELIKRLKRDGRTIVMSSHILSDIERVCDRGIIMQDGKIIQEWSRQVSSENRSLEEVFLSAVGGERT